jgi:DNA polymerase I-like protein with 3'-5' exonuclease and polymerase domains
VIFFDIETDGLLEELTKLHCIVLYDDATNTSLVYDPEHPENLTPILTKLSEAEAICAHYGIAFDVPALKKLFPWWSPKGKVVDTVIMGRLCYPDIKATDYGLWRKGILPGNLIGSHKLKAWGYRIGEYKGTFGETSDWSTWTPEMTTYCKQDVVVLAKLYKYLMENGKPSNESLNIELQVASIIFQQTINGVPFDIKKAEALYLTLKQRQEEVLKELQATFPPFYSKVKEFTPKADNKRFGYRAGCPMTKIERNEFNPASRHHIAHVLMKHKKWKPLEYTDNSGEPKIDETILAALPWPEAKLIAEYLMLDKRVGQLGNGKEAWMRWFNPKDGKIHGDVNTLGCVTGRMSHSKPNLGQVPASYSPYGIECRELFYAPPGYVMVGCDASGLEARNLGHYMAWYDDGAYAKVIVEGRKEDGTEIHSVNMRALGIASRDDAKTWFYAFMYGAGDGKLGAILGKGPLEGKRGKKRFLTALPALGKLTDAVKAAAKRGYLIGLDGRRLPVRSEHAALNTLLQSAGAVVMKKALCICYGRLIASGVEFYFVLNIHDEFQILTPIASARFVGETARQSIIDAGVFFDFKCPLDGEYKIGQNWAETH